jgi:hypothetical protein
MCYEPLLVTSERNIPEYRRYTPCVNRTPTALPVSILRRTPARTIAVRTPQRHARKPRRCHGRARSVCYDVRPHLAGVAQLVEQLIRNQQVGGSSPLAGSITIFRFVKDLAALAFCTAVVGDQIMLPISDLMSSHRLSIDGYQRAPRLTHQLAFSGGNSPIERYRSPIPDHRSPGGPAVPRTAALGADTAPPYAGARLDHGFIRSRIMRDRFQLMSGKRVLYAQGQRTQRTIPRRSHLRHRSTLLRAGGARAASPEASQPCGELTGCFRCFRRRRFRQTAA